MKQVVPHDHRDATDAPVTRNVKTRILSGMRMETVRQAREVISYVWTHPANQGQRIRSILRAIAFQVRGRLGKRTLAVIGARGRMWAELHYTASSNVVYANPPNWNEMQAWRRILKPGDLFVDVGSNVGSYAIWTADLGAEVIAIEPDQNAALRLRENVALNDFKIEVQQCALAGERGRMSLTSGLDTVNHLLMDASATGQEVEVRTLDDLLGARAAAGVKIDVEGVERLVLDGATQVLADHRIGVMQLEWNEMSQLVLSEDRAPVAEILHSCGYSFYRPDSEGVLHPADVTDYGPDVFAVSPTHVL